MGRGDGSGRGRGLSELIAGFGLLDAVYILLALFFNSMTAPMVKFTQNASGGYSYNKWCVYFFAELMKFVFAAGCCVHMWYSDPDSRKLLVVERRDIWQYAVPAFVFFAQNNLSFIALQHMSNSAFQLLLNTRIVAVALMSVVILRKPLNRLEWAGIVLLTNGAVQFQLSGMGSGACNDAAHMTVDFIGLVVMGAIVCCASGGNIATQMVMQKKMDQPLMLQNAILYVWGIIFNGINWYSSVLGVHSGKPEPWFGDVRRIQVTSMVFYAAYGLSISVILKRFGAITRTLISCVAIVCTAVIDLMWFAVKLSLLEATCFITIFIAIFIYSILAGDYVPGGAKAIQQLKEEKKTAAVPEQAVDAETGTRRK